MKNLIDSETGIEYSLGAALDLPAAGTDEYDTLVEQADAGAAAGWELENAQYYSVSLLDHNGYALDTPRAVVLYWPIQHWGCLIYDGDCNWTEARSADDVLQRWFDGELIS